MTVKIPATLALALAVTFLAPVTSRSQPQVNLEVAFPDLRFVRPVDMQHWKEQLFVVEQAGRIWTFDNDPQTTDRSLFLDIRGRVRTANNEEGLLGLAFHPDHDTNGFFYLYYSASSPRRSVLSRFSVDPSNPLRAIPVSEEVILTVNQPAGNHNGGQIAFGPDGYLYIAIGDGGGANDQFANGQNRSTLLGTIARIDVNQDPYGIPTDNPFANSSTYRPEIYAWGLRNPWRFSFDHRTGLLYAADVGQSAREEINLIKNGGNYGWNIMEGTRCFRSSNCNRNGLELPIFEYTHQSGAASVTGGYVYYGPRVPDLRGWYVFGDYVDGRVWGLLHDQTTLKESAQLINTSLLISSFGTDHLGEVYATAFDGFIYRFTATGGALGFEGFSSDIRLTQGMAADVIELPAATGGTEPYTYQLTPDLPAGLVFHADTRQLAGTPTAELAPTQFEYIATDASGRVGKQTFTLEVEGVQDSSVPLEAGAAAGLHVHGSYPNPFSDHTMISFDLDRQSWVSLELFDIRGRQVVSLPARAFAAGPHKTLQFPTAAMSSGPYLCRITASSSAGQTAQTITLLYVN